MKNALRPIPLALLLLNVPALLAFAAFQEQDDAPSGEPEVVPLVRGTDPEQFTLVEIDAETITISDDGEIALTGTPNGYFATDDSYENYILRFDWKYERPDDLEDDADFDGNSGVLLHIAEPHKVWPRCVEAQLMNRDAGDLFGLEGGAFQSRRSEDERKEARQEALKPVGEWNRMEIRSRDGAIRTMINDVLIDEGSEAEPSAGPIGWQSEGRPIRFRELRIQHLPG